MILFSIAAIYESIPSRSTNAPKLNDNLSHPDLSVFPRAFFDGAEQVGAVAGMGFVLRSRKTAPFFYPGMVAGVQTLRRKLWPLRAFFSSVVFLIFGMSPSLGIPRSWWMLFVVKAASGIRSFQVGWRGFYIYEQVFRSLHLSYQEGPQHGCG